MNLLIQLTFVYIWCLFGNAQNIPSVRNNDTMKQPVSGEMVGRLEDQIVSDLGNRGYKASTSTMIIDDEFCEYINQTCPEIRTFSGIPIKNETTKKFHIGIEMIPIKLLDVNEIEESISMRLDLRVSWGLPSCANWKEATELSSEASQRLKDALRNDELPVTCYYDRERLYIPQLLHTNAMGDTYAIEKTGNRKISVSSQGVAMMINKNRFDSMCSLDFTFFPFDTQECFMEISAFSSNVAILWTVFGTAPKNDFIGRNTIWEMVSVNSSIVAEGPYTNAQFSIKITRRPSYHLLLIIAPTTVLTFLQLAVFLLPFHVPERSGYSITVVLAMQVSVAAVYSEIPVTSQPVYLAYYVAVCQMIGAVMTMYVNGAVRLAERKKKIGKRIVKLDFIIGGCFAFLVLLLNLVVFIALTTNRYL